MLLAGVIDMVTEMMSEIQFEELWEIRNIRFDIDPDEEKRPIQRYLSISYNVEDSKGNAGNRGHMFVTNLRIIWQMASDNYINLSIGLDCINKVILKRVAIGGGKSQKFQMTLKTQNPSKNKYQFRFSGYTHKQLQLFTKIQKLQEKVVESKSYRTLNLSVSCNPELQTFALEDIKSEYDQFLFYEDNSAIKCRLVITNVRLVILKDQEKKMNYGIPWMLVKSMELEKDEDGQFLVIRTRGALWRKILKFMTPKAAVFKKFQYEVKSFAETYARSPILGCQFDTPQNSYDQQTSPPTKEEFIEIQETKVNFLKRNHAYNSNQNQGDLEQTFFNNEVGLMMQSFPGGSSRSDIWQILGK